MNRFEVKQCALCGKLFQSVGANICSACGEQLDKDFMCVRDYLSRAPSQANVMSIVENTGVSEKTVLYLIKERRLSYTSAALTSETRCASCGTAIQAGKLCRVCAEKWSTAVRQDKPHAADTKKDDISAPRARAVMHTFKK